MRKEKKGKAKLSSKGVPKRQNKLTWDQYEAALNRVEDKATYRGFRMVKGTMRKYNRNKLGLSAITTNGGCCRMGSTRSLLSITWRRKEEE